MIAMTDTEFIGWVGFALFWGAVLIGACVFIGGVVQELRARRERAARHRRERTDALREAASALLLARDLRNQSTAANDALEQIPVMTYDPHPWA